MGRVVWLAPRSPSAQGQVKSKGRLPAAPGAAGPGARPTSAVLPLEEAPRLGHRSAGAVSANQLSVPGAVAYAIEGEAPAVEHRVMVRAHECQVLHVAWSEVSPVFQVVGMAGNLLSSAQPWR